MGAKEMLTVRTCPNCGANVKGSVCEYCGSVDAETIRVDPGELVTLSFEKDGYRYHMNVRVSSLSIDMHRDRTDLYSNGSVYTSLYGEPEYSFVLEGKLETFKDHDDRSIGVVIVDKQIA